MGAKWPRCWRDLKPQETNKSYSSCASFGIFDDNDVIFQFHNEAAYNFEMYYFIEQLHTRYTLVRLHLLLSQSNDWVPPIF